MLVELWGLPDPAPKKRAPRAGKLRVIKGPKRNGAQRIRAATPRGSHSNKDGHMHTKGTLARKHRVVTTR
jgi:hypothetical protein